MVNNLFIVAGMVVGFILGYSVCFFIWMWDRDKLQYQIDKLEWERKHPALIYPLKAPEPSIFYKVAHKIRVRWETREPYKGRRDFDEQ